MVILNKRNVGNKYAENMFHMPLYLISYRLGSIEFVENLQNILYALAIHLLCDGI